MRISDWSSDVCSSDLLLPVVQEAMEQNLAKPVAALSGNRNFPGRVHPDLDLGFLMSPALVVAFALSGNADVNLRDQPVQSTANGAVYLRDIWPSEQEISEAQARSTTHHYTRTTYHLASNNP